MAVLFLASCKKESNNTSQVQGSEISIQTVSIVTCAIMAVALFAAYRSRKR